MEKEILIEKCDQCNKDMELVPKYAYYLEQYLGCKLSERHKKNIKLICQECKNEKIQS